MAQFIVRNLEDDVRDKLRKLARGRGTSMEEIVREILRGAVMGQNAPRPRLGSRVSERFAASGLAEEIAELRGHLIEPPSFDG